ncbi:MAG TPA: protein kinase [Pyrinomonadaceae bacterium]|jgi:Serine/threonine protein kinase|nr:protein kinase [Pyrinomonadaceae bacterium]
MNPDRPQQIDDSSHSVLKRESGQPVKGSTEISVSKIAADLLEQGYARLVGRTVGAYKILGLLGRGGMGEVYLAQDLRLGRQVALKFLPLQFTSDANRLRRFEQEARNASALNHPNIVTIHKIGQDAATRYIVTEYIEGKTLRLQMMDRRISLKEALDVAIQAASALAEAHAVGIIHRDVKPENIMIRPDGIVKVVDFGLAKLMDHALVVNHAALTMPAVSTDSGIVKGTTSYMSPEQARGLEIDARTDIWSLGVVLYEVITGRPPFEGPTKSDILASILTKQPPPLHEHSREAPAKLDWIVAKALRKDREERYQTVKELLADLRALVEELQLDAKMKHFTRPETNPGERAALTYGRAATVSIRDKGTLSVSGLNYLLSEPKHLKRRVVAFALILLLGIGVVWHKFLGQNDVKFSTHPGENAKNFNIYVMLVDVGTPLPLTTNPAIYRSPALSPDGRYLAFLCQSADSSGFCIVPALGGSERADADPKKYLEGAVEGRSLAWLPDGKFLAVVNSSSPQDPFSIFLLSLDSGEQSKLTTSLTASARR